MKQKRYYITAPLNSDGSPDVSAVDHAVLSCADEGISWDEMSGITTTSSPLLREDIDGNQISIPVEVVDPNFRMWSYVISAYSSSPSRQLGFSFVKTKADGHGILFICVNDDGSIDADIEPYASQYIQVATVLSVETDGTWSPSGVVSENENFIRLA